MKSFQLTSFEPQQGDRPSLTHSLVPRASLRSALGCYVEAILRAGRPRTVACLAHDVAADADWIGGLAISSDGAGE